MHTHHHTNLQCAHIMAMAVQRTFKEALVTVGPWTERGFFYDFDMKVGSSLTRCKAKLPCCRLFPPIQFMHMQHRTHPPPHTCD